MRKSKDQQTAEAEVDHFRKNLGPFVVAAEATRMPMLFTYAAGTGHPIIFVNDSFLSTTGYERVELLGQNFTFLIVPDADAIERLGEEFEGHPSIGSETRFRRRNGKDFWATTFISPVRDERGQIVQHFVSVVDVTKHKEEQAHSRMLIDELNHRVKNTLSTVQAIASQALSNTADPKKIRDAIESRLVALSRSHDLLTNENWEGVGSLDLVNAALEPFGAVDNHVKRFAIKGDNIRLSPKMALALGIALHELATNAAKYGALANEAGTIDVSWAVQTSPTEYRFVMRWEEKAGPPVSPPSHRGFGSQVIERGLAYELEGTVKLDYHEAGVICVIDFPIARHE